MKTTTFNKIFLEEKLFTIRELQRQYPTMHVGGSFGLFLQGIMLNRDWGGDIDMNIPELPAVSNIEKVDRANSGFDFEHAIVDYGCDDKDIPKVLAEVDVNDEAPSVTVTYKGFVYKVTSKYYIISKKALYAAKGNVKQQKDLDFILGQK